MHYLAEYGLFLAEVVTLIAAVLILLIGIIAISSKGKIKAKEKLDVKKLNEKYQTMEHTLSGTVLSKSDYKTLLKKEKAEQKQQEHTQRRKIYVVEFHGDIKASGVKQLREEITAILTIATPQDEVVVCLESPGGMVHSYGLAASQLARIRHRNIPITVIVDKVAASGGYLMACVANKIYAAPFAIIGSIGVLAQIPNFHRLLEKHDIEFEQLTAGEYKRTLTLFGKNTEKARKKMQEEIEEVLQLFKQFIVEYRPKINIDQVATGEHWYGSQALALNLIDDLVTSDDYLLQASKTADVYKVNYNVKKTFSEKFGLTAQAALDKLLQTWRHQNDEAKYL